MFVVLVDILDLYWILVVGEMSLGDSYGNIIGKILLGEEVKCFKMRRVGRRSLMIFFGDFLDGYYNRDRKKSYKEIIC